MSKYSTSAGVMRPALLAAMQRWMPQQLFQDGSPDGRTWGHWLIALTAVLTSWSPAASLTQQFVDVRVFLRRCWPRRRLGRTFQGLRKALGRVSAELLARLRPHLRQQMQALAGAAWWVEGFCAFSPDGSKFDLPRTAANKKACPAAGRKKSPPQLLLTLLYHLGTGLPWDWQITAGRGSERAALRRMLQTLPTESLLVADAGFVGYELLRHTLAAGHHVLIRVGANVHLLRQLGFALWQRGDTVYLWPQAAQRRGQRPLVLRRIRVRDGHRQMCLLTDIQDRRRLSARRARRLYALRWGVEVTFRTLKQTLEHRQLRSHTPRAARRELAWSVVGLWLLGLLGVSALQRARQRPGRLSLAQAVCAVREAAAACWPAGRLDRLERRLRAARQDGYARRGRKASRRWPAKKKDTPCGLPKVRVATAAQVQRAQELRHALPAA